MLNCLQPLAFHRKALHVVLVSFPLLSMTCDHACCLLLHLHHLAAAQIDILRTTLVDLMSFRRSSLQSAACGGLLHLLFLLLATRCVSIKTIIHVINV
jgi:hypothetical protein